MRFGRETDSVRPAAGRLRSRILGAGLFAALALTGWPAGLSAQAASGDETVVLAGRGYSVAVSRERGYPAFRWSGAPVEFIHETALARGRGTAATSWVTSRCRWSTLRMSRVVISGFRSSFSPEPTLPGRVESSPLRALRR